MSCFKKFYGLFKFIVRNLKKTKERGERDTVNLRARHCDSWSVTR